MQNDGTPTVQIFYKNTTAVLEPLHIPGCGRSCSLQQMYELYANVLPGNFEDECNRSMLDLDYDVYETFEMRSAIGNE